MKVSFIATSAAPPRYAVGDRVVYKFAEEEWYLGIVTKVDDNVYIHFDDDEKYTVKVSMKLKKVDHPKKLKTHLTDAEVKALVVQKTKVSTPPKAKSVAPPEPTFTKDELTLLAYIWHTLEGYSPGFVDANGNVHVWEYLISLKDVNKATQRIKSHLDAEEVVYMEHSQTCEHCIPQILKHFGKGTYKELVQANKKLESIGKYILNQRGIQV